MGCSMRAIGAGQRFQEFDNVGDLLLVEIDPLQQFGPRGLSIPPFKLCAMTSSRVAVMHVGRALGGVSQSRCLERVLGENVIRLESPASEIR